MENLFDNIKINLASPTRIRNLGQHRLSNGDIVGEITTAGTINYRTLKPEKGGLFCERIFGPIKSWECSCGKYKNTHTEVVCENCGVELRNSNVRRSRMGFIKLVSPVTHVWYAKSRPSKIALILDLKLKDLESIIYFNSYVVTKPGTSGLFQKNQLINGKDLRSLNQKNLLQKGVEVSTGALAIKNLLSGLDLETEAKFLRGNLALGKNKNKKLYKIRRIQLIEHFLSSKADPTWMVLDYVPVLPPELRPMVQLNGGGFATSDLNDLYLQVIKRNNRLRTLKRICAPVILIQTGERLLQEAVDALIDNSKTTQNTFTAKKRPLKSLSENLKGKQGRFRQNLLGKRVDFSGRSVITVGPELKLNQCGLPCEMAIELFKPFLLYHLISEGVTSNFKLAKRYLQKSDSGLWKILSRIMKGHPVILNRAPTLHRLGIQAFEPILVEGQAIQLHPLVCSAFNADFDGDQMAVHVPLSLEAQTEARLLMLAPNNFLSPATGDTLITPTQDMVLGSFYLTAESKTQEKNSGHYFTDPNDVLTAYQQSILNLHSFVWVRDNKVNLPSTAKDRRIGNFLYTLTPTLQIKKTLKGIVLAQYFKTTPGRILLNQCFN